MSLFLFGPLKLRHDGCKKKNQKPVSRCALSLLQQHRNLSAVLTTSSGRRRRRSHYRTSSEGIIVLRIWNNKQRGSTQTAIVSLVFFGLRIERGGGKSKCVIVEFLHVSDNKERWWEWGRNKEACHDGSLDLKPQSVIFEREQRLILFVSAAKRTNCIWVGGSYCMNWDWNRRKWISVWSRKASFSAHIKYIV